MRPPPTRLNPSSIVAPEPAALSVAEKFLAFLRSGPLVNGTVALAITVGFFHGWLKTHYPHPAVTFAFDGMLILALIAVFIQKSGRDSFIPPGPVGNAALDVARQ